MTGDHLKLAHSVLDWWSLAGVDQDFHDAPVNLLDAPERRVEAQPIAQQSSVAERVKAAPPATPTPRFAGIMPDTLAEFRQWLATAPDIPGAGPPAGRILPSGPEAAPLFVLTAVPDAIDAASGTLLGGEAGALFDRMIGAIGFARKQIGLASMAMTPVPGGRMDAHDVAMLTEIARRHIVLVKPKVVLLLGDKASRAILSTDTAKAQGRLLKIKLNQLVIPAVATFHPRTLIRNSGFKRAAWESLQLVQKVLAPL